MSELRYFGIIFVFLFLVGCGSTGDTGSTLTSSNIFGDLFSGSSDSDSSTDSANDSADDSTVASAPSVTGVTGRNPNAVARQINTRVPLAEYCPRVRVRSGAETYRTFRDSDDSDSSNVIHQATITKVARECRYVGDNLHITVGARGRLITGPLGLPGRVPLPLRVFVGEGDCLHYTKLHSHTASIADNSVSGYFRFVDDKVIIPAPTDTNILLYVGFEVDDYVTPNRCSSTSTEQPITSLY